MNEKLFSRNARKRTSESTTVTTSQTPYQDPYVRMSVHVLVSLASDDGDGADVLDYVTDVTCPELGSKLVSHARHCCLDFEICHALAVYRRKGGSFLDSVVEGFRSRSGAHPFPEFQAFIAESVMKIKTNSIVASEFRALCQVLVVLSECQLHTVRFVAVLVSVLLLPVVCASVSVFSLREKLIDILNHRTRDIRDDIRRLASIDGICRLWANGDCSVIDNTIISSTLCGLLSDPSRVLRIAGLNFIINESRSNPSRIRLLAPQLGESVYLRCFDVDQTVVVLAIRVLSDQVLGELMLGNKEATYQRIANLVWVVSDTRKRKMSGDNRFAVSTEALVFLDRHILAPPGILGSSGSDEQKLATVVEFIEQYTDGFVTDLTRLFVSNLLSYFSLHTNARNFLKSPEPFCALVKDTQRGLSSGSNMKRTNSVLEVLAATVQLCENPNNMISQNMINILSRTLESSYDNNSGPDDRGRRDNAVVIFDIIRATENRIDDLEEFHTERQLRERLSDLIQTSSRGG